MNIIIIILLIFITIKILKMSEQLDSIKGALVSAQEKVTKIAADVALLHAKIDAIGASVPTAEQWAEVQQLATELNTSLQVVDDATPEEV
jgi:hypothetical protein